eukprot:8095061-Ditylum_brightwellii.AAC.1
MGAKRNTPLDVLEKPLPELITDPAPEPEISETSSFASSRQVCSPSVAKAVLEGGMLLPSPTTCTATTVRIVESVIVSVRVVATLPASSFKSWI